MALLVQRIRNTFIATLENTTTIKSCLVPDGPQPLILMSLGRSGSGSTYQIIGNLTGMETPSEEYTGKTPVQSTRFFDSIQNDHGLWVTDNLCKKQQQYSNAGLIGFKWKPWKSIFSDPALDGLRFNCKLSKSNSKGDSIASKLVGRVVIHSKAPTRRFRAGTLRDWRRQVLAKSTFELEPT